MNDLQLQQTVVDELTFDPTVDAAHIGVFVHEGVVTLTGYVGDFAQKHAAENAVRRVKGVRALAQEIEVRLPSEKRLSDDDIAARAARILDWDLRLANQTIHITVEDGVVRLTGSVPWEYQRREAEADIRKLGGVVNVINHLSLRSDTNLAQVRESIRAALERAADIRAERIGVELDDEGSVILSGDVHSMTERTAVENAAWCTPGVVRIHNRIHVGAA
jgi:osmotically-inducible protein OsmY